MTKPLLRRRKAESSLDLAAGPMLDGETRQAWVYRQIRDGILQAVLAGGARVPSSRSLALRWGVSRTTVDAAYEQLRGEGYLVSTVGSGTFVAATVPDRFFGAAAPAARPAPASQVPPFERGWSQPFIARTADARLFPLDHWRKLLSASARRVTPAQLMADEPLGFWPLREQIARYLGAARGIACDTDQIIVLAGIRHGLDLCAGLLLREGGKVLLEDPGYVNAGPIFGRYARQVASIPIDEHGFSVKHARRHRGVRLACVTPAHQSPLGIAMPVSRRLELLAWAQEAGCWLVEDDYDSEFNYEHAPLPALKSLDTADRVIHCGSFNKTLFTALRIGYAVLPRHWVPAFSEARHRTGRSNSVIEQMALTSFLSSGAFARHVRAARATYARRRDVLVGALRAALGDQLRISGAQAGFHFVWWLPPHLPLASLLPVAQARGLHLQSVADFCRRATLPPGVLIGYSALQDEALQAHAEALFQLARCTAP